MISVKLNIGYKIARLEIMTLNHEKIWHVFIPMELMFTSVEGELHCSRGYFRKQTGREDV